MQTSFWTSFGIQIMHDVVAYEDKKFVHPNGLPPQKLELVSASS
jgi:hypothetical protein